MARSPISKPIHLLIPGLNNSGPRHWQTRWEESRDDCERVDLGAWSNPHRSHWVTKLDHAIAERHEPIILVAHSLGCLTVAWWAAFSSAERFTSIVGAMLVAPPDVEREGAHPILVRFAPAPRKPLPFPTLVVASTDDPYATIERSQAMADQWRAHFLNIGALGHINADSFLGDWPEGQRLLADFQRGQTRQIEISDQNQHNFHVSGAEPQLSRASPLT